MEPKSHWENVYRTKAVDEVSWFQEHAGLSLQFITKADSNLNAQIIDVGGGASILVDELLLRGYKHLTVLDISQKALDTSKARLGKKADQVSWVAEDVTKASFSKHHFDVWHDRAVFHFLTIERDRQQYVENVIQYVKPGGHVIVATFSLNGPMKCSGLDVVRYSPDKLHDEFGNRFDLINHVEEAHKTPFGTVQQFIYCFCAKK